MAEQVTLWKATNGMHYSTEADAAMAEASAELDAYLTSQPGGGGADFRARFIRLALGVWSGPRTDTSRGYTKGEVIPRERGAQVFARFAAVLEDRAMEQYAGDPGTQREADTIGKVPETAKVDEPVRRRAIRSGTSREPATPEGDSMRPEYSGGLTARDWAEP